MSDINNASSAVYTIMVPNNSSLKSINFFLVRHENSLSLIDAGLNNSACWDALQQTLKTNGFSLFDLTEIILTHHHIDHIGLVNKIISIHPIPVYASPIAIPRLKRDTNFLEMRVEFFASLYQEMGCEYVGDKQISYLRKAIKTNKSQAIKSDITELNIEKFNQFTIIQIPGHAPDQLAFFDKNRNWLFGGDLLISHISSNAIVEPDSDGKRIHTLSKHIDSLNRIMALNVKNIFSGHGHAIDQPTQLIKKRLARIEEKSRKLHHLISTGISTAAGLAKAYYEKRYEKQFSLVMSEIIGHLDYLESRGLIQKTKKHGVYHYSIAKVMNSSF